MPGTVPAVDLERAFELLGGRRVGAHACERASPLVQGVRLVSAQPVTLERLVRAAEAGMGLVDAVLERQHDRLRERGVAGLAPPVLAAAHDLPAAIDVRARLVQPSALGAHAGEVRPDPQLEIAGAAVDDDRERLLEELAGRLELPAQIAHPRGEVVGGPFVPAIPGAATRLEDSLRERLDLLPAPFPEIQQWLQGVGDPGWLRVGEEPPRFRRLAPRGVTAADAVGDLLPVGVLADVRQA